jgi:hypothetical protein
MKNYLCSKIIYSFDNYNYYYFRNNNNLFMKLYRMIYILLEDTGIESIVSRMQSGRSTY